MTRDEIRIALIDEYTKRTGLNAEEFEDVEVWVDEVKAGESTIAECIDYIIQKYDLTDLSA